MHNPRNTGKLKTKFGWQVEQRIRHTKLSAANRDIDFNITDELARELIVSDCTYCGCQSDLKRPHGIDRIDSSLDYEPGNVVACCSTCNMMKGTKTVKQFIEHCARITEHSK